MAECVECLEKAKVLDYLSERLEDGRAVVYCNVMEYEKPIVFYFEDAAEYCIDCEEGSHWEEKGGGHEE